MILTITMNPSVDISYQLEKVTINKVNRTSHVKKTAGGKGLNVTRVLNQYEEKVLATGLLGGPLGSFIIRELEDVNIRHQFFQISSDTRNCIAILHENNQTEVLESGPIITQEEQEGFIKHVKQLLDLVDIVVVSGSLPIGFSPDFYARLITLCHANEKSVVLDSSGESLKQAIMNPIKPKLIKPNIDELSELLQTTVKNDTESIRSALNKPLFKNIEWIVVSRGKDGAIAKHFDQFYIIEVPMLQVINPVGSGDSMVAGLTSGLHQNLPDHHLLKLGCTLGSLNALEETTGRINLDNYDSIFDQIKVTTIGGDLHDNTNK